MLPHFALVRTLYSTLHDDLLSIPFAVCTRSPQHSLDIPHNPSWTTLDRLPLGVMSRPDARLHNDYDHSSLEDVLPINHDRAATMADRQKRHSPPSSPFHLREPILKTLARLANDQDQSSLRTDTTRSMEMPHLCRNTKDCRKGPRISLTHLSR